MFTNYLSNYLQTKSCLQVDILRTRKLSESSTHISPFRHRFYDVQWRLSGGGKKKITKISVRQYEKCGFPLYFLREPCTVYAYETDCSECTVNKWETWITNSVARARARVARVIKKPHAENRSASYNARLRTATMQLCALGAIIPRASVSYAQRRKVKVRLVRTLISFFPPPGLPRGREKHSQDRRRGERREND